MTTLTLCCDNFGRPLPRLQVLTWRDTRYLQHSRREVAWHADWRTRAEVLTDLEVEAGVRMLDDARLHAVLGLEVGRLHDGTLTTARLRELRATLWELLRE